MYKIHVKKTNDFFIPTAPGIPPKVVSRPGTNEIRPYLASEIRYVQKTNDFEEHQ